jgi:RNA polymerase sigma factor (sigma-70 family)
MTDPNTAQRFASLVLPHLNQAFNLARWLTRNDQDAEDVVQEAYLRAYRFFPSLRGNDARAWLLTIVRNSFYTWHEHRRNESGAASFDEQLHSLADTAQALPPDGAPGSPDGQLLRRERQQAVRAALQTLPLEFREVIVLRELDDMSYKEIAAIVGIPLGTVMSRLARGRQLLATRLAPLQEES